MPCACNTKAGKFTVYKNGVKLKSYSTKMEADAAAKRVGGTVKAG